jgi:hypothetical protein
VVIATVVAVGLAHIARRIVAKLSDRKVHEIGWIAQACEYGVQVALIVIARILRNRRLVLARIGLFAPIWFAIVVVRVLAAVIAVVITALAMIPIFVLAVLSVIPVFVFIPVFVVVGMLAAVIIVALVRLAMMIVVIFALPMAVGMLAFSAVIIILSALVPSAVAFSWRFVRLRSLTRERTRKWQGIKCLRDLSDINHGLHLSISSSV